MRLAYEKKVLRNLTESIENPDKKDSQIKKVCWGITIVSWCLLLAAYLLAFRDQNPTLIAVLASFAGIAYGRTMFMDNSLKNWRVVRKFVDYERVKKELSKM